MIEFIKDDDGWRFILTGGDNGFRITSDPYPTAAKARAGFRELLRILPTAEEK